MPRTADRSVHLNNTGNIFLVADAGKHEVWYHGKNLKRRQLCLEKSKV